MNPRALDFTKAEGARAAPLGWSRGARRRPATTVLRSAGYPFGKHRLAMEPHPRVPSRKQSISHPYTSRHSLRRGRCGKHRGVRVRLGLVGLGKRIAIAVAVMVIAHGTNTLGCRSWPVAISNGQEHGFATDGSCFGVAASLCVVVVARTSPTCCRDHHHILVTLLRDLTSAAGKQVSKRASAFRLRRHCPGQGRLWWWSCASVGCSGHVVVAAAAAVAVEVSAQCTTSSAATCVRLSGPTV